MQSDNIFDNIPADLSLEVFDILVRGSNVTVERIVSNGQSSPEKGWYDQESNEWVVVLRGNATIEFNDGAMVDLTVGDYLNIPAHCKHRVTFTQANPPTVWLAVHYSMDLAQ